MKVAVVGGGINGLCTAWELAAKGHEVSLFERDELLGKTSSASSKLLHGGIRYLENLEFRLVKEALRERAWWLRHVPQYTSSLKLCLPVYRGGRRSPWKVKLGLMLYDYLASGDSIGRHEAVHLAQVPRCFPDLRTDGLRKIFTFFDGQMDEARLGAWAAEQARQAGVMFFLHTEVKAITPEGNAVLAGEHRAFDQVVNVAGPWAEVLCKRSGLQGKQTLDLVRGSHLVLDRMHDCGYLLEVPGERRVFFVLPYQGKTLLGTTEVRQRFDEPVVCSDEEMTYLLAAYNHYFRHKVMARDVTGRFAGVRPLIRSASDPVRVSREYVIERQGRVVSVFGGKWTTARALARKTVKEIEHGFH